MKVILLSMDWLGELVCRLLYVTFQALAEELVCRSYYFQGIGTSGELVAGYCILLSRQALVRRVSVQIILFSRQWAKNQCARYITLQALVRGVSVQVLLLYK